MTARGLTIADQFARAAAAEIVALHLLKATIAASPKTAASLIDGVADELKAASTEYATAARGTRDAKLHRFADAVQPMFDAMIKDLEALKPKV